jgi:HlyD family secretion protein
MKQRSIVFAIGLLVLLTLAAWGAREYLWMPPPHTPYRTARVERGTITATVAATGKVNPVIMVQVGTQVSGTIEKLFVDFNSPVHVGQQLAQLDQASFRAKRIQADAALHNARADVKNAQANVRNMRATIANAEAEVASSAADLAQARVRVTDAKRVLERQQALFARQLLARDDVATAQTAYDAALAQQQAAEANLASAHARRHGTQEQLHAAEAQVEKAHAQVSQAQAAVTQAQVDLDRTLIRSPIDGMVISRDVAIGQTVAASLQAPTLFTIARDLAQMQVDTNVSEADIGAVAVGQSVTFTVDAYPNEPMYGTIREIRSAPIVVDTVVHYNAVVAVDNPDLKLRPGMTATVAIRVAQRDNVLKVPKAALRFRPQLTPEERQRFANAWQERQRTDQDGKARVAPWQTLPKVWNLTSERALQPIVVQLGISDEQFSELTSHSLREGQELIIGLEARDNSGSRSPRSGQRPRLRL